MKCPACESDLTEDASYCPACLRSIPRTPSLPSGSGRTDLGGWETVLAGVLLLVVILSAVLLLG